MSPKETEWERINKVFAEAEALTELAHLRMEQKGEDYTSALNWAVAMVKVYSTNPTAT